LGIVFSLVWFFGVFISAGVEYYSVKTDLANSVQSPDPSLKAGGWEVIGQQTLVTNCGVKDKEVSCTPRFKKLALLALAPIAVAWVLILLTIYAVIWVHDGFKRDES
jgi:hypothetical protein